MKLFKALKFDKGAMNRAKHALEHVVDADYGTVPLNQGVGIESGLCCIDGRWFESGWIVTVDRNVLGV
jgi:non-canonical (house-cleaning) NTP pyrophosphatase